MCNFSVVYLTCAIMLLEALLCVVALSFWLAWHLWSDFLIRAYRIIYYSLTRAQGSLSHSGAHLPNITLCKKAVKLDLKNYRKYAQVCGYKSTSKFPICYPETYFSGLVIDILTHRNFALSPLGVIHIRQTMKQHLPISPEEDTSKTYNLTAKLVEYRTVDKGIEIDIHMEMKNEKEALVWDSLGTFLSRNKATVRRQEKRPTAVTSNQRESTTVEHRRIDVQANCGVEYAKVSGDINPHHLYPFTARLLGYPKPIAHGMWTVSRVFAEMFEARGVAVTETKINFKRPLFMPGRIVLQFTEADSDVVSFRVESADTGEPNLIGQATIA